MLWRTVDDQVVDHFVGYGGERGLAVTGLPCVPHALQLRPPAQPLLEGGVDGYVHVRSDGEPRAGSHHLSVLAGAHEDPGNHFLLDSTSGVVDDPHHLRYVVGAQPVDDGPVTLARGQAQHALAQASHQNRRDLLGAYAKAKAIDLERVVALGHLLAAQCVAQEAHHVAHLLVRLHERHTVPALDDHVAATTDADREAAGRSVGQRGDALREASRRPRIRGDDGGTQAKPGLPRGGHRQRSETVGAVALRRPDVGVAHVGQLAQLLAMAVQRARQRHGHSRSNRQAHSWFPFISLAVVSPPLNSSRNG